MNETPLYRYGDKQLFAGDFRRALQEVAVAVGDLCYCHTAMSAFGRFPIDGHEIVAHLANVLGDAVGVRDSGTLMLPAFCFDFYEGKTYDPVATPGRTGALNEYIREIPGTVRTEHPTFSSVLWGCSRRGLAHLDMDAFGQHSVFGVLHREDCRPYLAGKILCFGVPFWKCATFVHYVEQCWGVPYRTMKVFTGKVLVDGNEQWQTCSHFARPLDGSIVADFRELENRLRENGDMKVASVGNGEITCVSANAVYKTAWTMLDDDPYSLVERREA